MTRPQARVIAIALEAGLYALALAAVTATGDLWAPWVLG